MRVKGRMHEAGCARGERGGAHGMEATPLFLSRCGAIDLRYEKKGGFLLEGRGRGDEIDDEEKEEEQGIQGHGPSCSHPCRTWCRKSQ